MGGFFLCVHHVSDDGVSYVGSKRKTEGAPHLSRLLRSVCSAFTTAGSRFGVDDNCVSCSDKDASRF